MRTIGLQRVVSAIVVPGWNYDRFFIIVVKNKHGLRF